MAAQQKLTALSHSVFSIQYHLVLVTKYRRRCLTAEIHAYLKDQVTRLLQGWGCELLETNGEPDHVHLLISANPKVQPTKMVNSLKTATSRLIRSRFAAHVGKYYWRPVFWSRSYCLVSCGGAPLAIIRQYIENQKGFD
ncbi:MAG TPA: IS200/IS605 family transposase [Nevskiaceae bacterium]|nr:IS200/IS605 family transposase [Nevskiaceae bacterium]